MCDGVPPACSSAPAPAAVAEASPVAARGGPGYLLWAFTTLLAAAALALAVLPRLAA